MITGRVETGIGRAVELPFTIIPKSGRGACHIPHRNDFAPRPVHSIQLVTLEFTRITGRRTP